MKTVSNVVHEVEGKVSTETADRVRAAIAELGYRPNLSARRLRNGRSQVLALAVPDLRNPYFADFAAATIAAARSYGHNVFIEETGTSPEAEFLAAQGLDDPMIEGVILAPLLLQQRQLLDRELRVPLVLLGERQYNFNCDQVGFNNVEASRQLTSHLLSQGYRRIAVIGRQDDPPNATALRRLAGYRLAHEELGLKVDERLARPLPAEPYSRASGAVAMTDLLRQPVRPDAVFCLADVLAFGALSAAHDAGVVVPRDIALAGFDGLEEARYRTPTLTTVAPDRQAMAKVAVQALIERMQSGVPLPHRNFECGFELIVGESSERTERDIRHDPARKHTGKEVKRG